MPGNSKKLRYKGRKGHNARRSLIESSSTSSLFVGAPVAPKQPVHNSKPQDIDIKLDPRPALYVAAETGDRDGVLRLLYETPNDALFYAARYGRLQLCIAALNAGADVNFRDPSGISVVSYLSTNNTTPEVTVSKVKSSTRVKGKQAATVLMVAALCGYQDIVAHLLSCGADPNAVDNLGSTALMRAVQNGHFRVALLLMESGAIINARSHDGHSALSMAVQHNRANLLTILLEQGADPTIIDEHEQTLLHWAARLGYVAFIQLLVAHSLNLNARCSEGATPLMLAVREKRELAAELLVSLGADLGLCIVGGYNALHLAIETDQIHLCERMLNINKTVINAQTEDGLTLLMMAVANGDYTFVERLLDEGADPSLTNYEGKTALAYAVELGHQKMIALLATHPGKDTADNNGNTPLILAIRYQDAKAVKALIAGGVNLNIIAADGYTPLLLAVHYKVADIVVDLLAAGAKDTSEVTSSGATALMMAAMNGHHELLVVLLKLNTNRGPNKEGDSPLHAAVFNGHPDSVSLLLAAGFDPNVSNHLLMTPLHTAAYMGHASICHQLLKAGANPRSCDQGGHTPLTYALNAGRSDVVKLLAPVSMPSTKAVYGSPTSGTFYGPSPKPVAYEYFKPSKTHASTPVSSSSYL